MKKGFLKFKLIIIIFSLIIISKPESYAQEMPVPANLQAALFQKIFAFDKTLTAKGNIEVAVIGNSNDEIVAAFKAVGINTKTVNGEQVPAGVAAVYIMPGITNTKQQTASNGILSISGFPSYAEDGNVAIGIGVEGGKPKIIVNLKQLKAEGQELSADLLKIAKVIQ